MSSKVAQQEYIKKFKEISKEKWFEKNFLNIQPSTIRSDKNFINDMKFIKNEDKSLISLKSILNHIQNRPSEKRFNLLDKLFNFNYFNDEEKSQIISICFLSGKGKLFKRSLNLLSDNVLNLFSIQLNKSCFSNPLNNNVSYNIKILKDFLSKEQFDFMYSSLLKSLKTTNINSLFCSQIDLQQEDKQNLINFLKQKIYTSINYDRRHNININSSEFIHFYKNNLKDDYNLLIDIIIGSKKNIIPFINHIHKYNNYFEILYDKNLGNFQEKFFKQMVLYYFNEPENNNKINSFNKYFQIISLAEESLFYNIMKEIGIFMDNRYYKNNKTILFKKKCIETLNSRLGDFNLIIENENTITYEDLLKIYNIHKEKHLISEKLNVSMFEPNYKKRI